MNLLLLFLQNHWSAKGKIPLKKLKENKEILQYMQNISKFAFETLSRKSILLVFHSETDASEYADLEKAGFIVRVERQDIDEICLQFRHLVLQELLCAMYITFHDDRKAQSEMLGNRNLEGCLPLVAGLEGLQQMNSDEKLASNFVTCLKTKFDPKGKSE